MNTLLCLSIALAAGLFMSRLSKVLNLPSVTAYLVAGIITEVYNTTYGNLYIEDAEGNTLYIYGLYSADGSIVKNPTLLDLWFDVDKVLYCVKSGETLMIQ